MNEASYIRAVHRHLPADVHAWKVADRFARGVPDCWYSGDGADLWAEFKYLKKTPVHKFTPRLSALQIKWLRARAAEGRSVSVIVGSPRGGMIVLPHQINQSVTPTSWLSHQEIASWIAQTVCLSIIAVH